MKKRTINYLSLNKRSISNFNTIVGGEPPKSFFKHHCDLPPANSDNPSCFIESNCIGCTVTTQASN
ncbi:MAG: hypothetical protein AB8B65_03980 [Kordia sp.]|uniref:hypothetical protein n=1 Tax=Kordia sp. TaxID=1965332 RepID=UPI00385AC429